MNNVFKSSTYIVGIKSKTHFILCYLDLKHGIIRYRIGYEYLTLYVYIMYYGCHIAHLKNNCIYYTTYGVCVYNHIIRLYINLRLE